MKVIYNRFIPFKGYAYINLFGVIFARRNRTISRHTYNHEKIHLKQMQEMLWIGFYLWYAIEYMIIFFVRVFSSKQSERYHDVSFEEEAYNNDTNMRYCNTRKHYAWIKYIRIGSNKKK